MRVRFNDGIYLCTKVSHNAGSKLILFINSNGVYTVNMETAENADKFYFQVLIDGYCDVSLYEYSN